MDENNQKGQTKKSKQPGYEASKKRKQREKMDAIQLGTYQKPPIEDAKEDLKNIHNFNLAALLANPKFNASFDSGQLHQLKRFIANHKPKESDIPNQVGSKEQELLDIKEKAQRLGNQQIPLLHQSLLTPQTTSERQKLIKSKIDENLFLFLEYMDNQFSPSQDFLEIILEMYESFDSDTQTKLFVRVCALNKGEKLLINKQMVEAAMGFLTISRVDNLAAFGLLRLAFQNDISFSAFPLDLLQEFQQQYDQSILNFFKIIPQLKYQVRELLPATCFCFTSPMFKSLKEGGDILHTQIPYQFLPYVIEIISYSFTEEDEVFTKFLEVFKLGCKMHSEFLFKTDFASLLHSIKDKAKTRSSQFFMKLEYSTQVLKIAFDLIQQRKVENFDEDTIQLLLNSSQEQHQLLMQRPKVIKESSHNVNKQILDSIIDNNKAINLTLIENELSLSTEEQHIFKLMKISKLLYVQQICFKYCIQQDLKGGHYIQFDTGQGKTSLCLAVASALAANNKKVFITNKSEDLTFRDFKKANAIAEGLKLEVAFINANDFSKIAEADIIFITAQSLLQYTAVDNNKGTLGNCSCLVDEFDSIFFEKSDQSLNFAEMLTHFQLVIGFSGSVLQYYHKQFLEKQMQSKFITFSLGDNLQIKPKIDQQLVFSTLKCFNKQLLTMCETQIQLTPVLIILKDNFKQILNQFIKAGISVEALYEKDFQGVEGSLQTFNEKQNEKYQVYLLNEAQGRGLDFTSTSEIEQNGGIYLIIACLPSCYLQFRQFIGRTGRINCKGKYSVVLFDKESKNQSGEIFLNRGMARLENNDLLFVTGLKIGYDTKASPLIGNKDTELTPQQTNENEDAEMLDEQSNQFSHNKKISNSANDSDEPFEGQQLEDKLVKLQQRQEKEAIKRRERKRQDKFNSKQNKVVQQQQEHFSQNEIPIQEAQETQKDQAANTNVGQIRAHIAQQYQEECKTCQKECSCDWQKKYSYEDDTNLDEIVVGRTSEVAFAQPKEREDEQVQSPKMDLKIGEELKILGLDPNESGTNQKAKGTAQRGKKGVDVELKAQKEEVNAMYFKNYGAAEVQQEMLDDKARLEAYKRAIDQACKGKTVLDLGCGTGILSLYALQAGAKKAIGIDNADIQDQLNRELANFGDKFQFIKGTIENINVEQIGKVDVIVSEWMGYFLLYENMIDSYIYCIKNFLKPKGIAIPSEATMFLRAGNIKLENRGIQQNQETDSIKIVVNEECKKEDIISENSAIIKEFKFQKKLTNPLEKGFKSKFSLKICSQGRFNALIGSFQVKLGDFYLTTSPGMELTHWKHSIFFINEPVVVKPYDVIEGTIFIQTAPNNHRNLVVDIAHNVKGKQGQIQEVFTFE